MAAYTAIDDPEAYFQTKTYTGNNTDGLAITFDGDTDMSPNLIWFKVRSHAHSSCIADTVRGISDGGTKVIHSDLTNAETTCNASTGLKTADSDGFTLGAETSTSGSINGSSKTYVAWCWKESATSGCDIIQFTGNATARTISHSLSAVPKMILMKNLANGDAQWVVYHVKTGNTQALYLNTTTAPVDVAGFFNDTDPTSSVFTVGTDTACNGDGNSQINYAWSEKQGFSKFGTYVGNGNSGTDGTFVYLGFRPAMVLVKRTNGAKDWKIFDIKRNGYNGSNEVLEPNNSDAEDTTEFLHFLSNGFKWEIPSSDAKYADVNGEDDTFVYAAFAYSPFVNSEGVPNNAV